MKIKLDLLGTVEACDLALGGELTVKASGEVTSVTSLSGQELPWNREAHDISNNLERDDNV